MQPDTTDLYVVTEKRAEGQSRYIGYRPRLSLEGRWLWNINSLGNEWNERNEEGMIEDRGALGFAVIPTHPDRPLCVFEPLTLMSAKTCRLLGMDREFAMWDEDADVLDYFRDYFKPVAPTSGVLTNEEVWRRMDHVFLETRGVEAEVGDVHMWKNGAYVKQPNRSWRKQPSEWEDSHDAVPVSTKRQHYNSETKQWSPERQKLHTKILHSIRSTAFSGVQPVPPGTAPTFTFMIGPPAAGKSTHQAGRNASAVVLDPDEIVEKMPEFQKALELKVRTGASAVFEEACELNDKLLDEALAGPYNLVLSGTGSNLRWMQGEFFPALKRRGYKVNVLMAYVEDLDELLLRSEARGHKNGRFVPPERTEKLHEVLPTNFKAMMEDPNVDAMALMDSHVQMDKDGRYVPKQVYTQSRSNGVVQRNVHDEEYFRRVIQSAPEPT